MSDGLYEQVMSDIVTIEERLDALEERLDDLDRLAGRVDELDARTDIMQLVDTTDELSGRARSLRLLQHMQRRADRNNLSAVTLTHEQAQEALHYPDLDRTTIYSDMRRAASLIDDDAICRYQQADEGDLDEACVRLQYDQFQSAQRRGEIDAAVDVSTDQTGGA